MIILSDCLSDVADEGGVKVAVNLAKRIKEQIIDSTIISYQRESKYSDLHLKLNKFFLNGILFDVIAKKNENILYIPFASNTMASAFRALVLSCFSKGKVYTLFVLRHPMTKITKIFLELSKVNIIVLSMESYEFYGNKVNNRVMYLKTGIDTTKFLPVTAEKKSQIRKKYKVKPNKKVLLHVGHLNVGRNIEVLLNVSTKYHIFLVISSLTKDNTDKKFREKFEEKKNITIIDTFCSEIEEFYQMADVYIFPVLQEENCIDVPLSVLEAASCNIPIVCTSYGELKNFYNEPGFCFIDNFESQNLNEQIDRMVECKVNHNREAVMEYNWTNSVERLVKELK